MPPSSCDCLPHQVLPRTQRGQANAVSRTSGDIGSLMAPIALGILVRSTWRSNARVLKHATSACCDCPSLGASQARLCPLPQRSVNVNVIVTSACALCPPTRALLDLRVWPLLSRAGGCDKLRRCHRDDERIVLRLRVTVRVESARAAESALSIARPQTDAQIRWTGGSSFWPVIRFRSTRVFRVARGFVHVHTVREKVGLATITKNPNGACPGPCWLVPDRHGTNLAADQMLRLRT